MKIAVASDHQGFKAKGGILSMVDELHHEALDFGPSNHEMCDYPDYASKAALAVATGEIDRAILIGGTGIGMSIVANKFQGVRAALCYDDFLAEMSRHHYDANVLCLSVALLDAQSVSRMIEVWLETPFDGGRHARRIAKIAQFEQQIREEQQESFPTTR